MRMGISRGRGRGANQSRRGWHRCRSDVDEYLYELGDWDIWR